MNTKITLLTILLIIIIFEIITIIKHRRRIKWFKKLIKYPYLLDDYKWYAKQLDTKPLTDDEKREAFEKAVLKEAEKEEEKEKQRVCPKFM